MASRFLLEIFADGMEGMGKSEDWMGVKGTDQELWGGGVILRRTRRCDCRRGSGGWRLFDLIRNTFSFEL